MKLLSPGSESCWEMVSGIMKTLIDVDDFEEINQGGQIQLLKMMKRGMSGKIRLLKRNKNGKIRLLKTSIDGRIRLLK